MTTSVARARGELRSSRKIQPRLALRSCILLASASWMTPPALADTRRDNWPQLMTMTPTGVNLQTGSFVHSKTDFTIGDLSFTRSWRAVPSMKVSTALEYDHHFFGGWNHNYGFGVASAGDGNPMGVAVHADGKTYQFELRTHPQTGAFRWVPHNIDQFNNSSQGTDLTGGADGAGNYVFRNHNGDVYQFNSQSLADHVISADGTRLDFTYDTSKRLRTIMSSRGYAIVLDYVSGRLATACGYNRAVSVVSAATTCATSNAPVVRTSYTYAPILATAPTGTTRTVQQLSQVTDPLANKTVFRYDGNWVPNLTCVTLPAAQPSTTCEITNEYYAGTTSTAADQVKKQTTATGEVWNYNYASTSPYAYEQPLQPGEVRTTNSGASGPAFGASGTYLNGQISELATPAGTTLYEWSGLNLTGFTHPRGNRDLLQYDDRNNVTRHTKRAVSGSTLADIKTEFSYPPGAVMPGHYLATGCAAASQKLCNKPSYIIDARENRTDYTYGADHGMVLTETGPAVNGARPQKRFTYEQRYAGVKNGSGAIVAAPSAVWLLVGEAQCKTVGSQHDSPSPCAGTADEVRTTYEYGPSGTAEALLLRGKVVDAGGLNLRTCYSYDRAGNRISETKPKAGLSSCP